METSTIAIILVIIVVAGYLIWAKKTGKTPFKKD